MQVLKRSVGDDGVVELTFPPVRRLEPLWHIDDGLVKRIRGVAYPYCNTICTGVCVLCGHDCEKILSKVESVNSQ